MAGDRIYTKGEEKDNLVLVLPNLEMNFGSSIIHSYRQFLPKDHELINLE
jgi:hypothetical protein